MRCPECSHTLTVHDEFYDSEFVCDRCGYFVPRGAD